MNMLARNIVQAVSATVKIMAVLSIGALVACGGGTTDGQGSLLRAPSSQVPPDPSPAPPEPSPTSAPSVSPSPTMSVSPAPTALPSPSPQPTGSPEPGSSPGPSPSPTPIVLSKPQVSVTISSGGLNVNWGQDSAAAYRVLVYVDSAEPYEYMASGPSSVIPLNGFGSYRVLVEAYDHLGNSLFSDPEFVEVSQ